jgi:hypothetical protein
MHAGTKVGAERLLKRKIKEPFLLKSDFPKENNNMKCSDIENCLYIDKNKFQENVVL